MKLKTKSLFERFWLIGIGSVLLSCNLDQIPDINNTYLPKYQGDVSILLIKDTLEVKDVLENVLSDSGNVLTDTPDRRLILNYETTSNFATAESLVDVNDITNSVFLESPVKTNFVAPRDTTLEMEQAYLFNFPAQKKEEIDSVYYNGGILRLTVTSSFPDETVSEFGSGAFEDRSSGDTLILDTNINGSSTRIQEVPLNGYKTSLENANDSNFFEVLIKATVLVKQGSVLSGNERLDYTLEILEPTFEGLFGDFGQDTFAMEEKAIKLSFFDDFSSAGMEFENPEISMEISNSFGIPLALDFGSIYAENVDGDRLPFSGSFPDQVQLIESPDLNEFGQTSSTNLLVNTENSNLRAILASAPKRFVLDLDGYSNYNTLNSDNFLTSESEMNVKSKISIPLSVKLDGFEYKSDIELGEPIDMTGTENLTLLIRNVNELPFEGFINIYFKDEFGNNLDSIMDTGLFTLPVEYSAEGKVITPVENETQILLTESLIDALSQTSSISIVTRLNSYGYSQDEFVEIYGDYKLITNLAITGKLSLDIN